MEASVECTHCKVVMTSWSAPGSQIRYFQCPFCARTHSSLYGEVFRRRAGARIVEAPARAAAPAKIPVATADEVRWARVKQTAARWFARLEAEGQQIAERLAAGAGPRGSVVTRPRRVVRVEDLPEADPADVVLLSAGARRGAARSG